MEDRAMYHKEVFERISPEKQRRILTAAAGEFADKGFTAANINLIADKAGVSVGSMYKYFESKADLYLEVMNGGLSLIEEALKPILEAETDLIAKVDAILDAIFASAEDHALMTRLYSRFTAESDSDLARKLATRMESATASVYTRLIRQAVDEGYLPEGDVAGYDAFVMDNIFLTLQFSLTSEYWMNRMRIYLGDDIFSRKEELRAQMGRILKRALGAGGAD